MHEQPEFKQYLFSASGKCFTMDIIYHISRERVKPLAWGHFTDKDADEYIRLAASMCEEENLYLWLLGYDEILIKREPPT